MADEIKEGGLFWLGANVVLALKPRSGSVEIHRLYWSSDFRPSHFPNRLVDIDE